MNYRIGLDIGIASVGWAVLLNNNNEQPYKIQDLGVRIFDKAEHPKDGSSLAKPRREARSARRRNRRHRYRIEMIKQLISSEGLMNINDIKKLYDNPKFNKDVYELRYEALERKLHNDEFVRVLIHIAQRRGFKTNRKSELKEESVGKMWSGIIANKNLLNDGKYRTAGEMLYKDIKFKEHKRNKQESYLHTLDRSMLEDEIKVIFEYQRKFLNGYANENFEEKYLKLFLAQRSFDEGPGGNSPYGGNQIEKMLGQCTLEPDEKRMPKACYTFEKFMLLTKINTLKIGKTGFSVRRVKQDERVKIISEAFLRENISYKQLRKLLDLSDDEYFKGLTYGYKSREEVENKTKFITLKAYHSIRKALNKIKKNYILELSIEQLDAVGYALSVFKNDEKIKSELTKCNIQSEAIEVLLNLNFSKVGNLSSKAINKIMPYMEEGMDYDKACSAANYNFKGIMNGKKHYKLPPMDNEQITNPVVKRAISQTIKVINAIIQQYGSPSSISIELAREMSKSKKERYKIMKSYNENKKKNEEAKERLKKEFNHDATGLDIVKYKLWIEQNSQCAYSQEYIEINRLFETGYVDVDHIIPYSISFDDSYSNKVLVKSRENRQKGNRTPYGYFGNDEDKWNKFEAWTEANVRNYRKKQNLLKKELTKRETEEFKERNLTDTKYITTLVSNHIRKNLEFVDGNKKKKVFNINGCVTAYARKRWGLTKVREDGDKHHALDAVVIACITDSMIQRISSYHKSREALFSNKIEIVDPETGELISREIYDKKYGTEFPLPWDDFRYELEARLSENPMLLLKNRNMKIYDEEVKPIFISRMPNRKNKGAGHKETIKSPRIFKDGYTIIKKPLTELKLDKDGEIKDYYNSTCDKLLYNALKERLILFDGDAKKAFSEPFYKPKSNGDNGHVVKKIKLAEKSNLGVLINDGKGIADNGSMIRVDVFLRDGNYFLVPIYASDTVKSELPSKAIVANKPYDAWIEMEGDEFIFSLYPNDLIKFKHKKGVKIKVKGKEKIIKEAYMYYVKAGISTASITVKSHDNSLQIPSLGVKTLESLEKYDVDVLGHCHKVKRGKRLSYNRRREPCLSETL